MRPFSPFEHVTAWGRGYGWRERADRQHSTLPKPGGTPESLAGRRSLQQTQKRQSENNVSDPEARHHQCVCCTGSVHYTVTWRSLINRISLIFESILTVRGTIFSHNFTSIKSCLCQTLTLEITLEEVTHSLTPTWWMSFKTGKSTENQPNHCMTAMLCVLVQPQIRKSCDAV